MQTKDPALHRVLAALLRSCLVSQRRIRDLESVTLDVFILPTDLPFISRMKRATSNYTQTRRTSPELNIGQPAQYAFEALLEGLALELPDDSEVKATLTATEVGFKAVSQEERQEVCRLCKLETCYKQNRSRLIINLTHFDTRRAAIKALNAHPAVEQKYGAAPAGATEDEMSKLLEALGLANKKW